MEKKRYTFITILIFSGCTVKDDRLFQNYGNVDQNSTVSEKQYKEEVKFEYKIAPNDRVNIMVMFNQVLVQNR